MHLRNQDRIPLSKLDLLAQTPSPIKRKAKIYTKKLPEDFFISGVSGTLTKRNQVHTQAFSRRVPSIERVSETREMSLRVGHLSARLKEEQDKAMNLIRSVISTSKQMKKIIRKHSSQFKNENSNNFNQFENYRVQLPPLMLKKAVPTAF